MKFFIYAAFFSLLAVLPARAQSHILLIVVSAQDCMPGQHWRAAELPGFQASATGGRVEVRTIDAASMAGAYKDEAWPRDLRRFRDQARQRYVPGFIVVEDGRVVSSSGGLKGWRDEALPRLQRAAATQTAAR